ncbi:MAG: acyl-CoA dehydrogenase family protein [Planctomycetota bacterium]
MSNFFSDNGDLVFTFDHLPLEELASLQEDGFADAATFDFAPRDGADAVDSYRRVLVVVGDIAANFIAPRSEEIDREGNILHEDGSVTYAKGIRESLEVLSRAELMGMTLPRRFGGLNFPATVYTMATEIVSRADASLMNLFGLQGIAETINAFADDTLRAKYLPPFARGETTGAMVLTEPDAGSDLQNVQVRAEPNEDGTWRINGVKRFITNGCGHVLLVLARSEPDRDGGLGLSLFLCERQPGIKVRRLEDKLGIHGSPTCELQFSDALGHLVGERQRGLMTYVMVLMNGARVGIAAQALGIAEAASAEARVYAYTRQQFGRRIERIPPVSDLLANMRLQIEASRALLYETTRVVDQHMALLRRLEKGSFPSPVEKNETVRAEKTVKRIAGLLTPMSKFYCCEVANAVAYDAIQVLGGSGYMRDYPVERHYRDARITSIYEGTSQLQVVGAVGGILAGMASRHIADLAARTENPPRGTKTARAKLARMSADFESALAFVKDKGSQEYTDLVARKLVEVACDLIIGYLLLDQARHDKRKALLASRFVTEAAPRARMKMTLVRSGEDSSLRALDAIIGPPVGEE